ncbi:MAG: rifampicin phosphotransferase [Actinomycetota bacterium]|nr:rifampicin phosphotransferase [Actinomycetota bacterium]
MLPSRYPVTDPLHDRSGPGTFWTTVNAAEALPGVSTPLNWSWFGDAVERAFRWTFVDMGVLHPAATMVSASVDDRLWGVFYGRAAANLDTFRRLADLTPGTSGDALEQQIFGTVRTGLPSYASKRRYPVVAARMPRSALALPKVLAAHRRAAEAFWRAAVLDPPADAGAARARFADAAARFEAVMRPHTLAAMLAQAIYEQASKLTAAAGLPGLENRLMTGFGGFEETRLMRELWAVSRDRRSLDDFLAAHGYHGPTEGEISSRSWREDRAPVAQLIGTYRTMGEGSGPTAVEEARVAERKSATAELLAALPAAKRPAARLLLGAARRYIPLREVGKTAFLQTLDTARAAAHVVGGDLARRGVVGDPDDVFYLTVAELADPTLSDGIKEAVTLRRERREEYLTVKLPDSWTGQPEAIPITTSEAAAEGSEITGLAVSPGVAEGRARVVVDPLAGDPLQPGEILVCETTDPSWTSLFLVAAGLVIDIGGALSHGAILARELGVPCVINSRIGTQVLRTGDLLRVDGDAGRVEVLRSAG